jgi:hypothetical protein
MDFQSNCWVNLRILGHPCGYYLSLGLEGGAGLGLGLGRLRAEDEREAFLNKKCTGLVQKCPLTA